MRSFFLTSLVFVVAAVCAYAQSGTGSLTTAQIQAIAAAAAPVQAIANMTGSPTATQLAAAMSLQSASQQPASAFDAAGTSATETTRAETAEATKYSSTSPDPVAAAAYPAANPNSFISASAVANTYAVAATFGSVSHFGRTTTPIALTWPTIALGGTPKTQATVTDPVSGALPVSAECRVASATTTPLPGRFQCDVTAAGTATITAYPPGILAISTSTSVSVNIFWDW